MQLAWTGLAQDAGFTDYRPGSTEVLFLCEKTDELRRERPGSPPWSRRTGRGSVYA